MGGIYYVIGIISFYPFLVYFAYPQSDCLVYVDLWGPYSSRSERLYGIILIGFLGFSLFAGFVFGSK